MIEVISQAMIDRADIERVAREIGEAAKAESVVLFGSYATGRMTADSDVDFLVVAESDQPRHKRSRDLYRRIRPLRFPVDIVVYTPDEVRRDTPTTISKCRPSRMPVRRDNALTRCSLGYGRNVPFWWKTKHMKGLRAENDF